MAGTHRSVFFKMNNVIQDYAWGSKTSIESLFGIVNPDAKPQAELWMGAHANGCSEIEVQGKAVKLSDFIATDPDAIIGAQTQQQFGELPYLFKVLAAEKALSIQVHPNKQQAEVGFAKEEKMGIARNAANRNYKDPNHKPELVFALTPYQAMNGFRQIEDIAAQFNALEIPAISELVAVFNANQTEAGLRDFFAAMLSLEGEQKASAVNVLLAYSEAHKDQPLFALLLELAEQYPGDIGLFAPLMLNVLTLQPGEAMFLSACTPHAYIKGTGLEIMANSDNVLRAGLTPKYMDVPELVANTYFTPMAFDSLLLAPTQAENGLHYAIPVPDFKFSIYKQVDNISLTVNSAEIVFAIDAPVTLTHSNGDSVVIEKGQSVFIPAYTEQYQVTCVGTFARAYN
ncbi:MULTISPECIES: mannose-6-phosphate isomerase, class I [unclassified Photobacterium]|uniref:mannose-6-phosphate isomerase, class I n=1 Tax=unclassified Photobacterium TaxID=2628852 RepID=UPI001EDFE798|nr:MULTISPECIES: mannose-6-phosphate isomerase, class I [unclassified Photobacterium]MCG3866127.1 mannose-6-phosphate isomerase, class I [Photobacterium sp. Ph6]MCG3877653.1 mannose-6-phosphate isomerase, class I [Photobacterium sp. Ph5]